MAISISDMRSFLAAAYPSVNDNKLNGIRAEFDFYRYVSSLGFGSRLSPGGWIMRPRRVPFGEDAVAVFPESIRAGIHLPRQRTVPPIPSSVDAVANFLRPANIRTFFCYLVEDGTDTHWLGIQRGEPSPPPPQDIRRLLSPPFEQKTRRGSRTYDTDVSRLSNDDVQAEFPLVSLRRYIEDELLSETSDIDRLIWGRNVIYPVEVKEKTRATDRYIGDWFGLDAGPFAKLAYFAAWYGQLKSLFVVREISDTTTRNLVGWWAIEFGELAKHASWVFQGGGPSMLGSRSAVFRIPLNAFRSLDQAFLKGL